MSASYRQFLFVLVASVTACGGHDARDPRLQSLMRLPEAERTAQCLAMSEDVRVALFFASHRRHHVYYGLDTCFKRSPDGFLRRLRHEIAESGKLEEASHLAILVSEARREGALSANDVAALELSALCRLRRTRLPGGQPGACLETARRAGQ